MYTRMKDINLIIRSHTNLSMFEGIIALLESGGIYSQVGSEVAVKKIYDIAKKEQHRLICMHDKLLEKGNEK